MKTVIPPLSRWPTLITLHWRKGAAHAHSYQLAGNPQFPPPGSPFPPSGRVVCGIDQRRDLRAFVLTRSVGYSDRADNSGDGGSGMAVHDVSYRAAKADGASGLDSCRGNFDRVGGFQHRGGGNPEAAARGLSFFPRTGWRVGTIVHDWRIND